MGLTKDEMHSMIFAELGGTLCEKDAGLHDALVGIELSKEQYNVAFKRTRMWFSSKKGYVIYRPITLLPTVFEYKMKEDVENVLDVIFQVPDDVAAFFSLGFFDLIPYGPQSIGNITANTSSYSGFTQLLQYNTERKRVFSVEPDWFYNEQTRVLNCIFRENGVNSMAILKVKTNSYEPEMLRGKDEDLFYRYLLAQCKEIVGRVRSKYDSLPSANGQVTLDGKTLLDEAKIEKVQCEVELFASQGADLPLLA